MPSDFAAAAAEMARRDLPDLVVVAMAKDVRNGKVFIDWSQNSRHKTTIAPYSLRARARPTVSTPLTWEEVAEVEAGKLLVFEPDAVLDRVEQMGDLFASTLTTEQELPGASN